MRTYNSSFSENAYITLCQQLCANTTPFSHTVDSPDCSATSRDMRVMSGSPTSARGKMTSALQKASTAPGTSITFRAVLSTCTSRKYVMARAALSSTYHTYVYICIYVCICAYICVCVCMCVCMCLCMYVCMHACMYVYMYVCMCVRMCVYVCACACECSECVREERKISSKRTKKEKCVQKMQSSPTRSGVRTLQNPKFIHFENRVRLTNSRVCEREFRKFTSKNRGENRGG